MAPRKNDPLVGKGRKPKQPIPFPSAFGPDDDELEAQEDARHVARRIPAAQSPSVPRKDRNRTRPVSLLGGNNDPNNPLSQATALQGGMGPSGSNHRHHFGSQERMQVPKLKSQYRERVVDQDRPRPLAAAKKKQQQQQQQRPGSRVQRVEEAKQKQQSRLSRAVETGKNFVWSGYEKLSKTLSPGTKKQPPKRSQSGEVVDLCDDDDDEEATLTEKDESPPPARKGTHKSQGHADDWTKSSSDDESDKKPKSKEDAKSSSAWDWDEPQDVVKASIRLAANTGDLDVQSVSSSQASEKQDNVCRVLDEAASENYFEVNHNTKSTHRKNMSKSSEAKNTPQSAFANVKVPPNSAGVLAGEGHNGFRGRGRTLGGTRSGTGPKKRGKPATKVMVPRQSDRDRSPKPSSEAKRAPQSTTNVLDDDPILDLSGEDDSPRDKKRQRNKQAGARQTNPSSQNRSTGIEPTSFYERTKPSNSIPASSWQSANRRPTRSAKDKANRNLMIFAASDSDDDYEFCKPGSSLDTSTRSSANSYDVARISIGKKVIAKQCNFRFIRSKETIVLSYVKGGGSEKVQHDIRLDDLQEMKYYADDEADQSLVVIDGDDEDMAFLAMRITPSEANGLSTYSTSYDPTPQSTNASKKYITVEFRSQDEFRKMLNKLRKEQHLEAFMSADSKLDPSKIEMYASALLKDSNKEKENRISLPRKLRSGKKKGRETNKILLVYPFDADEDEMDAAAADLPEASLRPIPAHAPPAARRRITEDDDEGDSVAMDCDLPNVASVNVAEGEDVEMLDPDSDSKPAAVPMDVDPEEDAKPPAEANTESVADDNGASKMGLVSSVAGADVAMGTEACLPFESRPEAQETDRQPPIRAESIVSEVNSAKASDQDEAKAGKSGHRHFLTIREEDRERLDPTIYLNDSLVDFWMQWIWRKEDRDSSPLHIFSSHFYTTLTEGNGLKAVTTWTAKKGIDVFTKRFVFIPVNKELHWSLCVVVNPGAIVNEWPQDGEEHSDTNRPKACILFMDSLKTHRMKEVARNVRIWLNSEWNRLKKGRDGVPPEPFGYKGSMPVFAPKIPYQENGWDCGVFVCRYAFGMFLRRDQEITFDDDLDRFKTAITDAVEFSFDMADIERLREEIGILIDRLSLIYLRHKKEEEAKEAAAKAAAKEEKKKADEADVSTPEREEAADGSQPNLLGSSSKEGSAWV